MASTVVNMGSARLPSTRRVITSGPTIFFRGLNRPSLHPSMPSRIEHWVSRISPLNNPRFSSAKPPTTLSRQWSKAKYQKATIQPMIKRVLK